jgi:hypothetical protein
MDPATLARDMGQFQLVDVRTLSGGHGPARVFMSGAAGG